MTVIPCDNDDKERSRRVDRFVETLKVQAHTIGDHGLSELEFYDSGFFRAVLERARGQNSARMSEKRDFVKRVLNHMQDYKYIRDWSPAGSQNRYDYDISLPTGRTAAIELKGCMDGNNTNIFERPNHAQEFVVWSVCANKLSNMARNAWSGIHTRLSTQIIEQNTHVNGVIVWDWVCGSKERPCPKLRAEAQTLPVRIGPYEVPPPCLYVFPATIPSARNNPNPAPPQIEDCQLLNAFQLCFGGKAEHVNYVTIELRQLEQERARKTTVVRDGNVVKQSKFTPIRRK